MKEKTCKRRLVLKKNWMGLNAQSAQSEACDSETIDNRFELFKLIKWYNLLL